MSKRANKMNQVRRQVKAMNSWRWGSDRLDPEKVVKQYASTRIIPK